MMHCRRLAAHVELENARHHDHRLRLMTILEHREFDCFGSTHEQTSAEALLILRDPISAAVSADTKEARR
jgi:hypothetical protein